MQNTRFTFSIMVVTWCLADRAVSAVSSSIKMALSESFWLYRNVINKKGAKNGITDWLASG